MNFVGKLEKFMKFICDKYEANDTFRSYGEGPWQLIRESGIDFGDARAQLAAMDILLHHGLIEAVNRKSPKHITSFTRIRPSLQGLKATREGRQYWLKIASALAEGITEGVIKGLKK